MKFSIVIPTKEVTDFIRDIMVHYKNQTYKDFEILILSDIQENDQFENTRIITTGKAPPSKKRNIGVENAKGEIIAFIDDDAYPDKDWLLTALKEFEDKDIVAIGGPSIIPPNATFFQRVSNKVYELSSGKTGIRYGSFKREEIDDWPTCNFFARKKDIIASGGFDSKYWGGEDTQLCYSLLKTGKKMYYNPSLIIYHHPRKSLRNHLRQSFFWGMWRGFFMRIHEQSRQLVFFIPALFLLGLLVGGLLALVSSFFRYAYFIVILLYILYLTILGFKSKNIKMFFPIIFVTFITHIVYGAGFWKGITSSSSGPTKSGMHPKENLRSK